MNYISTILAGFVSGISIGSLTDFGTPFAFLFAVLALVLILLSPRYKLFAAGIFMFSVSFGLARFHIGPLPQVPAAPLIAVKDAFVGNVNRALPEPHSGILNGITVGEKSGISEDMELVFRKTGISHIVVLSGYNISVIAKTLISSVRAFLPRAMALSGGALGVIIFTLATGAEASAVRAAVMALVLILAESSGRVYQAAIALVAAASLMLLWDPTLLAFDLSFQLSFLATAGIIFFSEPIRRKLKFIPVGPKFFEIRGPLAATLAAQIAVLPLLLHTFGALSVVSIPSNILVLPFVPIVMALGFMIGIFGFLSSALAAPIAWIAYAILSYVIGISRLFAALPFASVLILFPTVAVVISYIAMTLVAFCIYRASER